MIQQIIARYMRDTKTIGRNMHDTTDYCKKYAWYNRLLQEICMVQQTIARNMHGKRDYCKIYA